MRPGLRGSFARVRLREKTGEARRDGLRMRSLPYIAGQRSRMGCVTCAHPEHTQLRGEFPWRRNEEKRKSPSTKRGRLAFQSAQARSPRVLGTRRGWTRGGSGPRARRRGLPRAAPEPPSLTPPVCSGPLCRLLTPLTSVLVRLLLQLF